MVEYEKYSIEYIKTIMPKKLNNRVIMIGNKYTIMSITYLIMIYKRNYYLQITKKVRT